MRIVLAGIAAVACFVILASPAYAGEEAEGEGWSLRLPDGFTEAMSVEGPTGFKITSKVGDLPIDGMPEIKAYTAGAGMQSGGMIMVARMNLSRSVTTAEELGLDELEALRSQLPDGSSVSATTVGKYQALEISMAQDGYDGDVVIRVLNIACGDYVVVIMLMADEGTFPNSAVMWADLKSSIDIDPPMSKVLLFILIGLVALCAMLILNRVSMRSARDTVEHTGRFHRPQDGAADGAASATPMGPGVTPLRTGVRPKVLPSRQPAEPSQAAGLPHGAPPPPGAPRTPGAGPSRPAPPRGAPAAPVRRPLPQAATRPSAESGVSRAGLRATRPASGQWGS